MVIELLMLAGYVLVAVAVLIWSLSDTAKRHEVDKALQQVEDVCRQKEEQLERPRRSDDADRYDDRHDDIRRRA